MLQRARRRLVLVGALIWLAFSVVSLIGGSGFASVWSWVLIAGFVTVWVILRVLTRDIAERTDGAVDEYEQVQRNRARNAGYISALLIALVLYVVFSLATAQAQDGNLNLLLRADDLLLTAFLIPVALPTFLLAWNAPVEEDDETHD